MFTGQFAMIIALMIFGAGLAFFGKGVLEMRVRGDEFEFRHFILENKNRLYLLIFGLTMAAPLLYLDPENLQKIFDALPVDLEVAGPAALGFALTGIVFMLPRNASKPPPEGPPPEPTDPPITKPTRGDGG
jgi:hypothetical protein